MQQLGFAVGVLTVLSGCAMIANLDDYAAAPQPDAPDGAATAQPDAAFSDARVASFGDATATAEAGTFDCTPSPDLLACADLATAWPYAGCFADLGNSVSFAAGALVAQIAAADGAYCTQPVLRTVDALTYDIDLFVDARSTSQSASVAIASVVFDVDYSLAVSIFGGHYELEWGHEGHTNQADLGVPVTTRAWTHVTMKMDVKHTVHVSIDGVPAPAVAIAPAPTQLQSIEVGGTSATGGPFLLRLRNLRVTSP